MDYATTGLERLIIPYEFQRILILLVELIGRQIE